MPLKQQTLATILGCKATRRLSRIGSHNSNWDSIESDDLIELLVDGALANGGTHDALKLRALSHGVRRVLDAKLATALEEGRARAEAARVAAREAADAATARRATRLARRDAAVSKLEAAAEAYLSANVPSIPTLSRLQDLEAFYNVSHAIPPRPLPPYRELPLSSVRFKDCMELFHQNVKDLA